MDLVLHSIPPWRTYSSPRRSPMPIFYSFTSALTNLSTPLGAWWPVAVVHTQAKKALFHDHKPMEKQLSRLAQLAKMRLENPDGAGNNKQLRPGIEMYYSLFMEERE